MCGITGYFNLDGEALPPEQGLLQAMCDSLEHRGPDEEGRKVLGPLAFGMRRLAIIDVKTGQQPICNETGDIWLVFNGEIYNFRELQEMVRARGHRLSTDSDTEVIVHLYEEFGVDCLKHMEGMFAFCLFDTRNNSLFLARDRMGEKPLHWSIVDGQFVFSSEIKGILKHPSFKRSLNVNALRSYLCLEYVPAPQSMFAGINKLLPAHYMLVKDGQVSTHQYWHAGFDKTELSEQEAQEKLVELLEQSVKLRLITEVPLGVFLSGGIDSSIVTALAVRHSTDKLKTFSVGFEDKSFDESRWAQAVADKLETEHTEFIFKPDLAWNTMQELWQFIDEPMADASILPTYYLAKMTRQKVTVALSGEGGDELFGGYPTYQAHKLARVWNDLPAPLKSSLFEPFIRRLPSSASNLSVDYKLKRFISSAALPIVRRHLRWMGSMPLDFQNSLLRQDVLQEAERMQSIRFEEELFCHLTEKLFGTNGGAKANVIDTVMRLDMFTYLPDDLLFKSDRASMAASLEARLPFLAFPVVDFALSLPTSFKLKGLTTKYLLKKATIPYLPKANVERAKKGFGIPVAKWLRQEFRPLVDEFLCKSFLDKQGLFEPRVVEQMLAEHDSGRVDRRKELWTLITFQWWWSHFLTGEIGLS